jgi:dolichol kinase
MAGTASLAIGWGLLGNKWLAFAPIAFMAWGDNTAGLARATVWRGKAMSMWPSVVMLGTSLVVATLFQPYWIGALGAVVATAAERFRPIVHGLWDDNWVVVAVSLSVMAVLTKLSG